MFIAYGLHYTRSTEEMYIQNWNRIAIGINAEFDFHSMISSPARSLATHFNAMNHNRICLLTLQLPCYNNRSIQCTNCYIYLKYILHLNLFSTSSYGHQNRISSHLLFQQAQSISTWENWKQSGWNLQNQCFCYSGVKKLGQHSMPTQHYTKTKPQIKYYDGILLPIVKITFMEFSNQKINTKIQHGINLMLTFQLKHSMFEAEMLKPF